MLDVLIAVILGIVEGITEWLPISSTGHMILVEQFLHMSTSHEFNSMFRVVIQLGAIMAVVVLYFNKLNPFSKRKSAKQKRNTINLWCKIVVACLPAAVIGLLFDDILDKYLYNYVVVALMLIIYGIFFILIEKKNEHTRPQVTKLTELTYQMALIIGGFQVLFIRHTGNIAAGRPVALANADEHCSSELPAMWQQNLPSTLQSRLCSEQVS